MFMISVTAHHDYAVFYIHQTCLSYPWCLPRRLQYCLPCRLCYASNLFQIDRYSWYILILWSVSWSLIASWSTIWIWICQDFDQNIHSAVNVAPACFLFQVCALLDRSACRVSVFFHGDVWTLWIRHNQDGSVLWIGHCGQKVWTLGPKCTSVKARHKGVPQQNAGPAKPK